MIKFLIIIIYISKKTTSHNTNYSCKTMTFQWPLQLDNGYYDEVITIVVKNDSIHFFDQSKNP